MNADFAPLIVRAHPDGGWEVIQSGKTTGQLCFGEMLETVVRLSNPGTPGPTYTMKSRSDWEKHRRQREERIAQEMKA